MLVTFTSEASGDISFFGAVAQRLLKAMGQSGVVPGALKADEVSMALERLQAAISNTKTKNSNPGGDEDEDNEGDISLSTRAVPLIAMLQAAMKENTYVMWQ